jgi:membrane protein
MARSHTGHPGKRAKKDRMTPDRLRAVLKDTFSGWWNDNVPRMGAALAYYTLFALAPILVVVIAVGGMAFGPEAVRGEIVEQIQSLVGRDGAQAIQAILEGAAKSRWSIPATIIGVITFCVGATGAFLELQENLNSIWRVKPRSRGNFLRDLLVQRIISFGLVLGFAFLLLTSLVVSTALAAVHTYIGSAFPGVGVLWVWAVGYAVVSLGVITLLFAMIYKVLPDVKLKWADVWVGALATAVLFTVGKFLIGLYLGTSSFVSTYGTAGSVIVVLVWVYYSSQIILLGAEFTRAYVERFGPLPPPVEFATKDPDPKK